MHLPLFGSGCALCIPLSPTVSLSPKRPKQNRRDSGVSTAVWEWLDLVYPRSPTGCAYPPRGPGRTEGTRVHPPLCGSGWPMHTLFSHGAPLSAKLPKQDRKNSGVSAAVWEWPGPCIPRSPRGCPYPPSGPCRTGGTRVYPLLCGSGWTLCILVLPQGVPITQAAQVGPRGLGCIRRCVGVAGPCISCSLTGRPYPQSGPSRTRRTRVYPLLCGSGLAHAYFVLPRGVPIPKAAHAGPEGLGCIHRCVGMP